MLRSVFRHVPFQFVAMLLDDLVRQADARRTSFLKILLSGFQRPGVSAEIVRRIPWDSIPRYTSRIIFKRLKDEIIHLKDEGAAYFCEPTSCGRHSSCGFPLEMRLTRPWALPTTTSKLLLAY